MLVGFQALADQYSIKLVQPLRVRSVIGARRASKELEGYREEHYSATYQPDDSFAGHFEFGLKYEEIHLEFFARLFAVIGSEPIEAWCKYSPYGQYARRAGFFYEWLIQKKLEVVDVDNGAYCDAISSKMYLVRTHAERVKRWRINNNLPGNTEFCPVVRLTPTVKQALKLNFSAALEQLNQQFGLDILLRSASWLTFKESRASFLIEKESEQTDRVQRFAHVMVKDCGKIANPLAPESLEYLQSSILGKEALGLGVRKSPVFIGQASFYEDIVHYIAPHFEQLADLLTGLGQFNELTQGQEALARAAVLAFAFVYIHPMRDGNGRLHRFLINDTLIRDGAIPENIILPISATITSSLDFRVGYDKALEAFSKPFMQRYAESYRFGKVETYTDGTHSNFIFSEYNDALPAWRYPDLTEQVLYTAKVVAHTIHTEMATEAQILLKFQSAQQQLKNIVEMPDYDANRIIRSLKENNWQISNKLKKEYPILEDAQLAERILEAVKTVFFD
ncbi:MAG: hypothetical protein RL217_574 [Pseudomonadota bacterium]|jgi:hypothetical protein